MHHLAIKNLLFQVVNSFGWILYLSWVYFYARMVAGNAFIEALWFLQMHKFFYKRFPIENV